MTEDEDGEEFTELVEEVFHSKAASLYKDWKCELHTHYKKQRKKFEDTKKPSDDPCHYPFRGVDKDEWKFLIDHIFKDPTFQKRQIAGERNRKELPYGCTLGSRSIPTAMTMQATKNEAGEWIMPDFCLTFKASHTLKETGELINSFAQEKYDEMVALQEKASQAGIPLSGEEISREVLGERKNYIKGFGVGPKPSSYSSSKSSSSYKKQLDKVQSELQLFYEQQRERDEEQRRRDEEQRRRDEARDREIDELRNLVRQMQNGGSNIGLTN